MRVPAATLGINAAVSAASEDVLVITVPATEYSVVAEELAPTLNSGQTVFIVGAAFGAALEMSTIIGRARQDLNINLIETARPFAKEKLVIAGRTLNETRAALNAGNGLFNNPFEPASNLIDRAFADINRWLETAAVLFNAFDRTPHPEAPDSIDCSPTDNTSLVLAALSTEIESLGKAYGVRRKNTPRRIDARAIRASSLDWRHELAGRVIEDYVILSSLARLTYMAVPMIDTVIELASVVSDTDIRKEARQLTDLGLIGMDAREIIEHVSA